MSDGPTVAYAVGVVCAVCAGDDADEPCANALTASEMSDGDTCMECGLAWDARSRLWVVDMDDEWDDDE